ncbi:accessory Sec system protein Asp2 [Ignatzschineria cameli]|uniref:Uncharacterized protein n=1 Tax=Ignatzschineria cameli TaxID=2182793 RepID=A0A2U2ASQ2_9GAMM|nr:accessory Sec system protein Asp2 [Ignatzschineria cameli]PWD87742.1 hypothetical protein DC077_00185 [Ignatzschineria cameli]
MKEKTILMNSFEIKYVFKEARYDTDHLIVVFSGFGGKSQFTYDFKNSLETNRANILWIKDDFVDGVNASYYLDSIKNGVKGSALEEALYTFIISVLEKYSLDKDQCTLLGCSKGGTSALYYGLKYNFKNIIVSAPTIRLGSFLVGKAPKGAKPRENAQFLLEDLNKIENIDLFDDLILECIKSDKKYNKNIYFIASKIDPKFKSQIEPYLHMFLKYENFNYIETVSKLVRTHADVTFHNAPLILSILGSLSFNLPPIYNRTIIGTADFDGKIRVKRESSNAPVFQLKELQLKGEKFFLEGVYFLRDIELKEYSDVKYTLILESDYNEYALPLAIGNKPELSKNYYKNYFVNYDKGYFTTPKYGGINLDNIECGVYSLKVIIKTKTKSDLVKLNDTHIVVKSTPNEIEVKDKVYRLKFQEELIVLEVKEKES